MKVAVFETGQTPRVATIRDPSSFPAFLECPDKDGRPDGRVRGGVVGWCRMVVGSRCCQRKQPKEEELGLAFDLERDPAVWSGSRGRGTDEVGGMAVVLRTIQAVFHGWCSGSMICVGSTTAEGARRSKGQAGKGRSRRAKALMSPVEGLEGGSGRGGGGVWKRGRVQGVCERPLPTLSSLTHHLHSPTCTHPLGLAHIR